MPRLWVTSVLSLLLLSSCLPPEEAIDDAAEMIIRYHAERLLESPSTPWEAICLTREAQPGRESESAFLRRFTAAEIPVVPEHRCRPGGAQTPRAVAEWRLAPSGERAIRVILEDVRQQLDGSFLVVVSTSTGTNDYATYDCSVSRRNMEWRVDECVLTMITMLPS